MPETHHKNRLKNILSRMVKWLRQRNLAMVAMLLLVAGGSWCFIELADEVLEGDTQAFDEWVLRSLRKPNQLHVAIGPHWLRQVMRDITALGGGTVLTLLTVAVAGFFLLVRNRIAMWTILAASIGGQLLSSLLKHVLDRQRPQVVPHLVDVSTLSFPSGHSMMSATVYLTLGVLLARFTCRRRVKSYFVGLALVVTMLVGASRVYLGVHYPTDVLAGWSAGAVWALLCGFTATWIQPRRPSPLDE